MQNSSRIAVLSRYIITVLLTLMKSGEISISNARLICSILTPANQDQWLEAASHLSKRDLELAIVSEHPERTIREKLKQVTGKLQQ